MVEIWVEDLSGWSPGLQGLQREFVLGGWFIEGPWQYRD